MKVSTVQQRIATKARNEPELCFTALNHYLDLDWLYEAYRRVRKDVVPGVDGVTAQQYEVNLDNNLRSLQDRLKSGRYIAPPVKRVHIPKDDGSGATRPIGLPAFEDKIAQRAVVMLLSPIYEQDFLPCSHGFREKRSAHQALGSLRNQIMDKSTWWILEVDIKSYFDSLVFKRLRAFLDHRVRDGVVRRLINKWLKAGVVERTQISYPTEGTSQGGVLSPLLSNIYLHYVLDEWFKDEVKPRLKGKAFLVRYADDFVLGFQLQSDAERVLEVLPKRFGKYGLRLHPDKTRMVAFGRPPRDQKRKPRGGGPASFDFLGFTHYWGRSMKGNWVVKQKTARKRYTRSLIRIREWLRRNRHRPVQEQHAALCAKIRGHFTYFGLMGNSMWLDRFRYEVSRAWRKWLNRRTRGAPKYTWDAMTQFLRQFPLPPVRLNHAALRRIRDTEEPDAVIQLVRNCGGAGG